MTAIPIIYQDVTLNKGFSKIYLLRNALGITFDNSGLARLCFFLLVSSKNWKKKCRIATHLEALDFDVSLVATEWFLCLFSKSLPSEVRLIFLFYFISKHSELSFFP